MVVTVCNQKYTIIEAHYWPAVIGGHPKARAAAEDLRVKITPPSLADHYRFLRWRRWAMLVYSDFQCQWIFAINHQKLSTKIRV